MNNQCPVCNSQNIKLLYKNSDIVDTNQYSYFQCADCNLMYIDPVPSDERLAEIYSFTTNTLEKNVNILVTVLHANPFIRPLFDEFGARVNVERANAIQKYIKDSSDIVLDVGCGGGALLEELTKRNIKSIGQEISDKCIAESQARTNGKVELINKKIEEYEIPTQVKVIALWHVFEHLNNYKQVLEHFNKTMQKNTVLIMETPSASALSLKLFKTASAMILTPEHITFWSKKSYEKLLPQHGFEVIEITFPKTFIFTSTTASFNYLRTTKFNALSLIIMPLVFLFSLAVYYIKPEYNESIRVVARKK